MSEEIKEILDKLQDSVNYPKIDMPTFDGSDSEYIDNDTLLEPSKCKLLLNYITNLQKENENLKEKVHNQKLSNAYATIQNNKLQTRLKTYKRRKTAETQKKRIYKSRNEKAIEYIKERKNLNWYADGVFVYELLNILQGGDE